MVRFINVNALHKINLSTQLAKAITPPQSGWAIKRLLLSSKLASRLDSLTTHLRPAGRWGIEEQALLTALEPLLADGPAGLVHLISSCPELFSQNAPDEVEALLARARTAINAAVTDYYNEHALPGITVSAVPVLSDQATAVHEVIC